jgi:uncharacterized membrane protein
MKIWTILVGLWLLAMAAIGLLMPWFTRPDLFFGVTVSPDFRRTDSARRLIRLYRAAVCLIAAAALAVVLSVQGPMPASPLALLVYLVGTCVLLATAHRHALRYATARASTVEVDLSATPERMPGGLVGAWLPFAWLFALGLWAGFNTHRLPARLILHWGAHGPDRWVATTPESVLAVLGLTGVHCLVLALIALGVMHWSRRISTSGAPASSERQFRRRFVVLVLAVEYLLAVLPAFMLTGAPRLALRIWSLVLVATVLVCLIQLMRAGQGGTHVAAPKGAAPVGDRTDDANWLGGLVYFNRADRALLVEKRMGLGWTFNLGNPWSWVLLAGLFAVPVFLRVVLGR